MWPHFWNWPKYLWSILVKHFYLAYVVCLLQNTFSHIFCHSKFIMTWNIKSASKSSTISFSNLNISNLWMLHFYSNLLVSKHSLARIPNIAKSQNHTCHYIRNKSITKLIFLPFLWVSLVLFFWTSSIPSVTVICSVSTLTKVLHNLLLKEYFSSDWLLSFHGYLGVINSLKKSFL